MNEWMIIYIYTYEIIKLKKNKKSFNYLQNNITMFRFSKGRPCVRSDGSFSHCAADFRTLARSSYVASICWQGCQADIIRAWAHYHNGRGHPPGPSFGGPNSEGDECFGRWFWHSYWREWRNALLLSRFEGEKWNGLWGLAHGIWSPMWENDPLLWLFLWKGEKLNW